MPRSSPSELLLTAGGTPNLFAHRVYTEGDCWLLAFYLGVFADLPLTAVVSRTASDLWYHVFVDTGDDTLLDVRGKASRNNALRAWGDPKYVRLRDLGHCGTLDQMFLRLEDDDPVFASQDDENNARFMALTLIDLYLPELSCKA